MMNDNTCWISIGDMLKALEQFGTINLEYSMGYWDCTIDEDPRTQIESKCYSHPYYAVKDVYDQLVGDTNE